MMLNSKVRKWTALTLPLLLAPSLALSATTYDRAKVVSATPVYETIQYTVPVEACRKEEVAYANNHRRSFTGPILGAIIGGALGNAVGNSNSNRKVGAVVGAVLGGSIGADISRRNSRRDGGYANDEVRYRTERVCNVSSEIREEERLAGYNVSYVYAGETYTTHMNRDPGDSIRVRVRVSPAQ